MTLNQMADGRHCFQYLNQHNSGCIHYRETFTHSLTQARREPQRGPGKHYRGALSPQPHSVYLEIETPKASRWRKRGLGERRKLPQRGPGRSPGRKWILCIFQVRKKPPGALFSVFFERRRPPPNVAGPGKTFPLYPPLDGPALTHSFVHLN